MSTTFQNIVTLLLGIAIISPKSKLNSFSYSRKSSFSSRRGIHGKNSSLMMENAKMSTVTRKGWFFGACTICWLAFILPGCLPSVGIKPKATSAPSMQQTPAQNQMARIAVARFENKTGQTWWTGSIGDGMADQLATALVNTNRFIVLERQALEDVLKEQDLGATGRIRSDTAAAIGQIEGASLLVLGAVTEFEGATSGGSGSASGSGSSIIGAILGGFEKAHMAIDLRIIDTKTSRILVAKSVEGAATNVNLKGLLGAYDNNVLNSNLSAWQNTPTEKALRICIQEAVKLIESEIPETYFRHAP